VANSGGRKIVASTALVIKKKKQQTIRSKIAVVFHSGFGHTARVAEFVATGANAELIAIDTARGICPRRNGRF